VAQPDATNLGIASQQIFSSQLTPHRELGKRGDGWSGASDPIHEDPTALTYELGFGLHEKPFSLSPDPRFFFKNSSHGATFDALLAGIRRREGILALTGGVGTGKTTLCRAVLQSLDRKTFAAFVPDPFLSREDLLKTLLVDFGVVSVEDISSGRLRGASRTDLSYTLSEFLKTLQPLQAFAVVVIDEAQNLPSSLLEEIRVLSDLESHQKLLQLVLVGQPELQSRLDRFEMRQLAQRLSIQCQLPRFTPKDVGPYVSHRLLIAGNNVTLRFTDAAIDLICSASDGIPRVINLVCDRALARAASAGTMRVDAEHILGAIDDLKLPMARGLRSPALERPGPQQKPSEREGVDPPTAHEEHQPPPQVEGSKPVREQTINRLGGGVASATQQSPLSQRRALYGDRPRAKRESLDHEVRKESAGREGQRPQQQPPGEASLPVDDPTVSRAGGQSGATVESPFSNWHTLEWDGPGPNLESLDQEWREASAEREGRQPRPHSQSQDSLPAAAPAAGKLSRLPRAKTRASLPMRHTELGSQLGDTPKDGVLPPPTFVLDSAAILAANPRRRTRLYALVIFLLALTAAVIGYQYWMSTGTPQPPDGAARPGAPLTQSKSPV
jgi:type II secretory pathway predicted ATPase ExeA